MGYKKKSLNYFMIHDAQAKLAPALSPEQAGLLFQRLCLHFLQRDDEFCGKMDGITEAMYGLVAEQMDREREAYEELCEKNAQNVSKRYERNTSVYERYTMEEKEKEKENKKENKKENENDIYTVSISDEMVKPSEKESVSASFLQDVVDRWNTLSVQNISRLSKASPRCKSLIARAKEYGEDAVIQAIDNIANSQFLCGQNNRGWTITFDWFVKPTNFVKVYEGQYADGNGKRERVSAQDVINNFL